MSQYWIIEQIWVWRVSWLRNGACTKYVLAKKLKDCCNTKQAVTGKSAHIYMNIFSYFSVLDLCLVYFLYRTR